VLRRGKLLDLDLVRLVQYKFSRSPWVRRLHSDHRLEFVTPWMAVGGFAAALVLDSRKHNGGNLRLGLKSAPSIASTLLGPTISTAYLRVSHRRGASQILFDRKLQLCFMGLGTLPRRRRSIGWSAWPCLRDAPSASLDYINPTSYVDHNLRVIGYNP
jgi:hypothetical protein